MKDKYCFAHLEQARFVTDDWGVYCTYKGLKAVVGGFLYKMVTIMSKIEVIFTFYSVFKVMALFSRSDPPQ